MEYPRRSMAVAAGTVLLLASGILYTALADNSITTEYDPMWFACDGDDATCTAIVGSCGEWVPVNTRSTGAAAAYYTHLATLVRCVQSPVNDDTRAPPTYCAQTQCMIGYKPDL